MGVSAARRDTRAFFSILHSHFQPHLPTGRGRREAKSALSCFPLNVSILSERITLGMNYFAEKVAREGRNVSSSYLPPSSGKANCQPQEEEEILQTFARPCASSIFPTRSSPPSTPGSQPPAHPGGTHEATSQSKVVSLPSALATRAFTRSNLLIQLPYLPRKRRGGARSCEHCTPPPRPGYH